MPAFTRRFEGPLPLISCLMPTYDRREFVEHSVRSFLEQTYPERELVVVDDSPCPGDLAWLNAYDPRIRVVRLPAKVAKGEKRNMAAELARGEYFAHWDDDDFYGPRRLAAQLEPILFGDTGWTAFLVDWFVHLPEGRFARFERTVDGRKSAGFADGTMVFHRRLWDTGARYAPTETHEITPIYQATLQLKLPYRWLASDELFVYVRHSWNSWDYRSRLILRDVQRPTWFTPEVLATYRKAADACARRVS